MTTTVPPSPQEDFPATAIAGPYRLVLITLIAGAVAVQLVDYVTGQHTRGALLALLVLLAIPSWFLMERGDIELSAALFLLGLVFSLTARMWLGYGLRDFAIAVYPAVLFLGCIFLRAKAYWVLAGVVLACAASVGLAEMAGVRGGIRDLSVVPGSFANLMIILGASALGGRVLMQALRIAFARERAMSVALRDVQERSEKISRSSRSAIVVTRLDDGTYLEVNDAYLRMFGHARKDILGRRSTELGVWEDPAERERFVREVRENHGTRDFDARLRNKAGDRLEVMLSAELLTIDGAQCVLVTTTDITAERAAKRRVEFLATRDALTGLPSRALAIDRLARGIDRARRTSTSVGVLQVGLDRLKAVNVSLGRAAGDALLREASSRIEAIRREGDTLARLGGDELLYIADPLEDAGQAEAFAARILAAFEAPFASCEGLHLTCSIGIACFPADAPDVDALLHGADAAMHVAKEEGRGRSARFRAAMAERARDRHQIEGELRKALARGDLRLAYQPKFDLGGRGVTGVEALARWTHAELGEISPSRFVGIAEESDLIEDFGRWALAEACAQIARWQSAGYRAVPVAVNLSARQLDARLPGAVADAVRSHGIGPGLLEFEVTESMLIVQPDATHRLLQQLKAQGSRIVLDDFGVGYSSLNYVKRLPIDGLKIDRSFVGEIAIDRHDAAIVRAIVSLAHGLDLRVVAEGIENQRQLDALRAAGCEEGQGFLLGRPTDAAEVASRYLARE